jgi:hypothetical protein
MYYKDQVVSHLLPIAATGVRSQVRSCGVRDGRSGTGAGYLRVARFFLPILIPATAVYSTLLSGAGTIEQTMTDVLDSV